MQYKPDQKIVNQLLEYHQMRISLETIQLEIDALKEEADGIRAASTDGVVASGGVNRRESMLIDNISQREMLTRKLKITEKRVTAMDKALRCLDEHERLVIDCLFLNRKTGGMKAVCAALGYEKTAVYKLRKRALAKLERALAVGCD